MDNIEAIGAAIHQANEAAKREEYRNQRIAELELQLAELKKQKAEPVSPATMPWQYYVGQIAIRDLIHLAKMNWNQGAPQADIDMFNFAVKTLEEMMDSAPVVQQKAEPLLHAIENCRLYAARHRKEEWAGHILRFCADAGASGSPMREAAPVVQQKAEPVAWMAPNEDCTDCFTWERTDENTVPLYAAPVAQQKAEPVGYFIQVAAPGMPPQFNQVDLKYKDDPDVFAFYAEPVVPDGMVLVPREPTQAMLDAGCEVDLEEETAEHYLAYIKAIYDRMIAAAQEGKG